MNSRWTAQTCEMLWGLRVLCDLGDSPRLVANGGGQPLPSARGVSPSIDHVVIDGISSRLTTTFAGRLS
jgi:hypothetical protein